MSAPQEYSVLFIGGPAFAVRGVVDALKKRSCPHPVGVFDSPRAAARYLFGSRAHPAVFDRTSSPMLMVFWPGADRNDELALLARVRADLVLKRMVAMVLTAGGKALDEELAGPTLYSAAPKSVKEREHLAERVADLLPSDDLAAMRRVFRDVRPTMRLHR